MYPTAHKDPRGGHNRAQINHNFFKTWSPSMAYVLGFIFADGAIEDVQKSSRTCYLAITCTSKDYSIVEKIRDAMNSQHKFYKRLPKPILFPRGKYYTPAESFVLRIGSKLIYNDLLRLGVTPRKSLTISFPNVQLAPQKIPYSLTFTPLLLYFSINGNSRIRTKGLKRTF